MSAKLKKQEYPSYHPDLRVPYVTITANQLWGEKTDQVLRDFLLRPQNYIQKLLNPQDTPQKNIATYIFEQLMLYFKKENINNVISRIKNRFGQSKHQNLSKNEVILLGLYRFATLFGFTELPEERISSDDRKGEKTN